MAAPGSYEFKHGWPIVFASCVGIALGLSPIPFYEISLLAPRLAEQFGWGIGTIMAGVFFMMCGSLIASPVVGFLADRYGARRVALISIVCFGVCLSLFALQSGSLLLYYGNWFLMAFTGAGTLPITWTRSINQHFDTKKGLALGIALAGTGLSGFLLKPATHAIIGMFGWRGAFLFLAALPLVIAWPVAALYFRQPAPEAGAALGNAASVRDAAVGNSAPGRDASATAGLSFRQAVRDWRFWIIGLGILPVAFAVSGPIANLESILKGNGVAPAVIVSLAPFVAIAVIVGRLLGGWLLDRAWAPGIALGLFSLSASASWLMVNGPPSPACVLYSVVGVGLAAGLEFDLMAFLTARYFGTRSYGSIYGTQYAFFGLGAGVAPLVYGRAFDATGSFTAVVGVGAAAMFSGGVLLLLLGPYRYRPDTPRDGMRLSAAPVAR